MTSKSPYQIIVRPIITEKALAGTAVEGEKQYTFQVAGSANKREIKWAVETAYGVKVTGVNTVTHKGKNKYSRLRGTKVGKAPNTKKAIVKLAQGQAIELM